MYALIEQGPQMQMSYSANFGTEPVLYMVNQTNKLNQVTPFPRHDIVSKRHSPHVVLLATHVFSMLSPVAPLCVEWVDTLFASLFECVNVIGCSPTGVLLSPPPGSAGGGDGGPQHHPGGGEGTHRQRQCP